MGSFNTPTPVYSAERPFKTIIDNFATFKGIADNLIADATMGLMKKDWNQLSLKGAKNILDPSGEPVGLLTATFAPKKADTPGIGWTSYLALMDKINNMYAERCIEDGATAVEDTDKRAWSFKFNIETAAGDDCYLQVSREKAVLSSYNLEATLQTINTWCNTIPAMDNDITA